MTIPAGTDALLSRLENQLLLQAELSERMIDYDMNDEADEELLRPFPELHSSLKLLAVAVGRQWRENNALALHSQIQHRVLARTAIASGTTAIVMAVVQLAMKQTIPKLTVIPFVLEALAVFSALAA